MQPKGICMKTNNSHILVEDVVQQIRSIIDCTQKTMCSLIGVTETTLTTSLKKSFEDIAPNKLGRRIYALLYVVETLKKDSTLSSNQIIKVLNTAAHQIEDGSFVDVVSLINSDKFVDNKTFLIHVADEALKYLRKKYETSKRPIDSGLSVKIAHQLEAR